LVSIRNVGAVSRVPFAWFSWQLRRHRVFTRIAVAGIALSIAVAVSTSGAAQAGLAAAKPAPASILPQNVGVGILTGDAVTLDFGSAMDRASVQGALSLRPSQPVRFSWSAGGRFLHLAPARLWRTDQRYLVVVGTAARRADGWALEWPVQYSFTTQTAPRITDIRLRLAGIDTRAPSESAVAKTPVLDAATDAELPPADVAGDVSTGTTVSITFGATMNRLEVMRHFALTPATAGTFSWDGLTVTFHPAKRLVPNARYAVSLAGVHDAAGNALGGDTSFSFTTRPGAQIVRVTPGKGALNVTDRSVALWFSEPMNTGAVNAALKVTDTTRGTAVSGKTSWNKASTQLSFTPTAPFAAGHKFTVSLQTGSVDADGNGLTSLWVFTTKPVVYVSRPPLPHPPASSDAITYALDQINASRAAYGLPPLAYSSAIAAVASAHAWDQLQNGYFSHTGLDGSTTETRLRAAGISFGWSGENECTYSGYTNPITVLDKCHAYFMSEPYPGYPNHIGNILGTHYHKVGIGIAQSGSHIIIVWDFTD
jgi:uncharacterized protein YkwD